jgi:hypothetical protein
LALQGRAGKQHLATDAKVVCLIYIHDNRALLETRQASVQTSLTNDPGARDTTALSFFARNSWRSLVLGAALLLGACGGGGGGSAGAPQPTTGGSTPPPDFPVLASVDSFGLPAIDEPPARAPVAGKQLGRVIGLDGAPAPAGLTVEWLDATNAAAPRLLASGSTDAGGAFELTGTTTSAAADQWLRVTLPNGARVRAYPTGWTEISAGTEVAVSEIARLRADGAFTARALSAADLAKGQEGLGLLWLATFATQGAGAIDALKSSLALSGPWNGYLDYLSAASADGGPGDIAALMPAGAASFSAPATLVDGSTQSNVTMTTSCMSVQPKSSECMLSVPGQADTSEQLSVRAGGILLHPMPDLNDKLEVMLAQAAGDLPILEFAPMVGTRVVYENLKYVDKTDSNVHAAIRITRRTYPAAPVAAVGGTVQAVQVMFEYQIALLNISTRQTGELLVRERRWFTPLGGRVKVQADGVVRANGQVERDALALTAAGGGYATPASLPFAAALDAAAVPLLHRDVVYSAAQGRVYAVNDSAGGTLLELDPATLATLRSAPLAGVTSRLAVSADGARLYAGQDGGTVVELRTSDLAVVRRFGVIPAPSGTYDRIVDLAVDPLDAERVLVLAGDSHTFGTPGALLLYRAGALELRDAPGSSWSNYGWDKYSPGAVAWSGPDEFLAAFLGSPQSVYRFGTGAGAYSLLASLERVDDIGVRVAGGELLAPSGRIYSAQTFAPLRALGLGTHRLASCLRIDATSNMCAVPDGGASAAGLLYARFDNSSGAFLGAYRPADSSAVLAQCPIDPVTQLSLAYGGPRLTPMGDGRILVSNGNVAARCGVQVWVPHALRR